MLSLVPSCRGVPIRLTDERWSHIIEQHCELAGLREEILETVSRLEYVLQGGLDERVHFTFPVDGTG